MTDAAPAGSPRPPDDPDAYDHWIVERARFSDTDAMGHVNNVAIAAYVESGRVAFLRDLVARGAQVYRVSLRHLELDYRAEIHYPDEVRVGSRLLAIGRTSLTVGTGIFRDGQCLVTAAGVLVNVGDGGAEPIPRDARQVLEAVLHAVPRDAR